MMSLKVSHPSCDQVNCVFWGLGLDNEGRSDKNLGCVSCHKIVTKGPLKDHRLGCDRSIDQLRRS